MTFFLPILNAMLVVGITGLIIGIILGIAGKLLAVKEDPRVRGVRDLLPGSNCGGCGFTGCDALAAAIVTGQAPITACAAAFSNHEQIASVVGQTAEKTVRKVAVVHCAGTCDKTKLKYDYHGITDCRKVSVVPGRGSKLCTIGCLGFGSCTKVCNENAINIINGVAVVSRDLCIGCGACAKVCPNGLIEIVPETAKYSVQCSSPEHGKNVRVACEVGCIGCKICVKNCESQAITVENNLATINPDICTSCGKCAEKCPRHIILKMS